MQVQRLLERFGFHHLGMHRRARGDRSNAARHAVLIGMHQQINSETTGGFIAKRNHFAKFPGRIDVEQRERQRRRIECLDREVQQNGAVLADRIHQNRVVGGGDDLAEDMDALGFQALQMRQAPHDARTRRPSGVTCRPHSRA
jgi:hypothetical protein